MFQQLLVENIFPHLEELQWLVQVVIAGEVMVRNVGGVI